MPDATCPQCSEPTTHGERCGACLKSPPFFDAACAVFPYLFPVDRIIHTLKYGHQLILAPWLGERLGERLANRCTSPADLVIPLPLHTGRLRERGFNQAVEIARPLARQLSCPLEIDTVIRRHATRPQAELPLKERAGNVRGAFECARDLAGRSVYLVDDVMTSGATLNECARILKLHGASRVVLAVIARALR
jgi:ComF family protein